MTRPILETRRQVVLEVINAYPGGRECAAARLGYPLKKFDNHAYENAGHRPLTDEQLHLLEQAAGTTFLPDFVCGLYGGVFVPMPESGELDNLDLYQRSLVTDVAEGKVDQIISRALKDGRLAEGELAEILAAHREHIAARHAEIAAVVVLHTEVKP